MCRYSVRLVMCYGKRSTRTVVFLKKCGHVIYHVTGGGGKWPRLTESQFGQQSYRDKKLWIIIFRSGVYDVVT